ncbi:2-keto-myo-inositol isomerase [Rhodoferax ferrireducens]|uniref:2-keto-myo-inositol isomerase n=1 Tax=Rhodoferax ferrireducens TaxID=192843 RepID=A0ABU2C8A8_9BURK|nr:TIM barrel protein [Rhodoferax ferrireducens]MDR7377553.1 2-keto-myo-inositol isomerase [Rhodoferax ferrireducens]
MSRSIPFSINRISAPRIPFADFAALVKRLGVQAIEIRNDLPEAEMVNGAKAADIGAAAKAQGLTIRSINALQRFEQFDAKRLHEAQEMIAYAVACGAEALVLCPTNDLRDKRTPDQRHLDLVHALTQLKPLLDAAGLVGLVEPLGFEECAVRRKSQAVRAIREINGANTFKLVHDTFHHHLAGEGLFFPELTGLIHISGVEDTAITPAQMRDSHRVLVGAADRLGNATQLNTLLNAGYTGYVSFEPFAEEIAAAKDIEQQLASSMAYLTQAVAAERQKDAQAA